MQFDDPAFNLNFNLVVAPKNGADDSNDDSNDDNSSVASDGSHITIEIHSPDSAKLNFASDASNLATAMVAPYSPSVPVCSAGLALIEMPPGKRRKMYQLPDDYHILIWWSQLVNLAKSNFSCSCGKLIKHFNQRTLLV
jgi:hypothetical protein